MPPLTSTTSTPIIIVTLTSSSTKTTTPSTSSSTQPGFSSTQTQSITSTQGPMVGQVPLPNVQPWNDLGFIKIPAPLHPLPKYPERWLPKFNPDDGLPAEECIHNYMLAINLKEVTEEDCVVRLFPYTLTRSGGSWYFSLLARSITRWNMFEEIFLTKFGDYKTTASLINEL